MQEPPKRIWLSRHGESVYNTLGLIGGDSELSRRGEEYARQLPETVQARIASICEPHQRGLDVWTSKLRRTQLTTRFINAKNHKAWKELDEISAGDYDEWTYEQVEQRHPEDFKARSDDKLGYRYPNGESYLDVIARVQPVVAALEESHGLVLVVAHQAVLRCVYGQLMCIPAEEIPRLAMPLHTVLELEPMGRGTYIEKRLPIPIPSDTGIIYADKCGMSSAAQYGTLDIPVASALY